MTATRWAALGLFAVFFALNPARDGHSSISPHVRETRSTADTLQRISEWLEKSGVDGAMGAEVADVLSIPRLDSEEVVIAKQMAFQSGETLHLAQVSADDRREFLMFMVKQPGRVIFYLSTVAEGFKKAIVSIPEQDLVIPLDHAEAERGFLEAVSYWQEIVYVN
jgi:hypothetical protein